MVFQRGEEVLVFGWGDAGNSIEITFKDQIQTVNVTENGTWKATFQPIDVGEPFKVVLKGDHNSITLTNCVAGEVWICSGQSNMEWPVARSANATEEIAAANYPMIRHIAVDRRYSMSEERVQSGGWKVCTPETTGSFTAVGYYFGRHLYNELNVPIGLINTTWGGTPVEAWTSSDALSSHPDYSKRIQKIQELAKNQKENAARIAQLHEAWNADLQKALNDRSDPWQAADTDDTGWKVLKAPGFWESQGFKNLDGVAWYRKSVSIPEGWNGEDVKLSLARIDDKDETYVNGRLVGSTDVWNEDRIYDVPGDLVKAGSQISIAVRVTDTGYGGGIYHKPKAMRLIHPTAPAIPLNGAWKFKVATATANLKPRPKSVGFDGPRNPSALYNGMVHGLIPFKFKGVIWYQGESNAGRSHQYRSLFPLMINNWRSKWKSDFPFYWVQLANFMKPNDSPVESGWAELREAQSMALKLPNTGEAVIIDIGEENDIHPKNKQDVGKRLALIALAKDYGKPVVSSGPRFSSMNIDGDKATLSFDSIGSGLVSKDGDLQRFQIAGNDKTFYWANAKIDGDNVVVSAKEVNQPVAVRYAWSDNPHGCNLYNVEGLPASPFRTDDWPGVTVGKK